nr:ATP synthase F0 subunit 8 [Mastotermes darwiniensis]
MPQMMPLSWLMLFFMFSLTFLLFNVVNYYSHIHKNVNPTKKTIKVNSMNWKW